MSKSSKREKRGDFSRSEERHKRIEERQGKHRYEERSLREQIEQFKKEGSVMTTYTEGGRLRKQCPKCNVYVHSRTLMCPACEHEFVAGAKAKAEAKVQDSAVITKYSEAGRGKGNFAPGLYSPRLAVMFT